VSARAPFFVVKGLFKLWLAIAILTNPALPVFSQEAAKDDWLRNAQALERHGHWQALMDLGQAWTRQESGNPLAWFVLGRAYSALGRYPDAIAAYHQNLGLDPHDSYAYNNLGNAHYTLGQHREALEAYRGAVRADPDYLLAWRNLGQTYYLLKGPAGVARALRQLQARDPALALAWGRLAATYAMTPSPHVEQQAIQILRGLTATQREHMFAILLATL